MPHEVPDLSALPLISVPAGLADLVGGAGVAAIEQEALPPFLARQRWFGAKARTIRATRILDHASLPVGDRDTLLCLVRVDYESGEPDEYFVPMALASGHQARAVHDHSPGDVIARTGTGEGEEGILYDAGADPETATVLLAGIQTQLALAARRGSVRGVLVSPDALDAPDVRLEARRMKADHSNTALTFGDRFIMKLFRRLEPGPNPDFEIGSHLTRRGFQGHPAARRRSGIRAARAGADDARHPAGAGGQPRHGLGLLPRRAEPRPRGARLDEAARAVDRRRAPARPADRRDAPGARRRRRRGVHARAARRRRPDGAARRHARTGERPPGAARRPARSPRCARPRTGRPRPGPSQRSARPLPSGTGRAALRRAHPGPWRLPPRTGAARPAHRRLRDSRLRGRAGPLARGAAIEGSRR